MGPTSRAVASIGTLKPCRRTAAEFATDPTPTSGWEFDAFRTEVGRTLDPKTALERVLADRIILASWRLQAASQDALDAARDGDELPPVSRDELRAERSLETTLELLETARAARWPRRARVAAPAPAPTPCEPEADHDDDLMGPADCSNEWPVIPAATDVDEEAQAEAEEAPRWQDRLVFDENVSETSPVVKGTWVTVGHVVSLIVDGWTWSDILRSHPELTEDDIRTCLAYTAELDDLGAY
jgi:uncharacterized protein (DUF433 family)